MNIVPPLNSRVLLRLLRLRCQSTIGMSLYRPCTQEVVILLLVHVMIVETGEWVLVGTLTLRVVVAQLSVGINLAIDTFTLLLSVPLDVLSLFIILRLMIIIATLQLFNLFIDSVNGGLSICSLLMI